MRVSCKDKEDMVKRAVSDTGIGISRENIPRAFNKFEQFGRPVGPGEKGTGLGLSIAKGVIDMHKGNIWIESEPDKGSTFVFTLPKKA